MSALIQTYRQDSRNNNRSIPQPASSSILINANRRSNQNNILTDIAVRDFRRRREETRRSQATTV